MCSNSTLLDSFFSTGYGPCPGPIEPIVIAAKRPYYIAISYHTLLALLDTIPYLEEDGRNWSTFAPRFREAMKATHWGYFDGTNMCPIPKDPAHTTNAESEAIEGWKHEDDVAGCLLSFRLPDWLMLGMDDYPTARAQWDWLTGKVGQPGPEDSRREPTREPPVATGRGSGQMRCRGKCHKCREEGHCARDCCTPKEEPATALITEEPSGAAEQPETSPADVTHTAKTEGEGCSLAEEGDTHVQIVSAEAVLSRQRTRDPDPKVHAQTVSTEPSAIPGEPGAIEEGAHAHGDCAEPDLKDGQPGDPNVNTPEGVAHGEPDSMPGENINSNANAPVHLEGTGPEVLMDTEEDQPYVLEEDGIARENASVEEDGDPRIELQEPGVSHLATQEKAGSLTLSSLPPLTTLEAASTQCSPAVNTGTPAIPEPDRGANLEPQPHDTPQPNEAAEPHFQQPLEQIHAPTVAGGPLESLPGEESQRVMGQTGQTSAHALEGKTPIGEAHGRPPDLPDPQRQGSIVWEPAVVVSKAHVRAHQAQRPVPDEGACVHPDPWPSPDVVITKLDACLGSAIQLEGEQNIHVRSVGSELHAAPLAPQNISSSSLPPVRPPSDTLARANLSRGEGAATEQRATKGHCPKLWKPPDLRIEVLEKSGGASALGNSPFLLGDLDPFGLPGMAKNTSAGEDEPLGVDVHKRGGALPVVGTTSALAEGTASVGPAGKAEIATTAEPEALAPRAQDKAGHGHEVDAPPQRSPNKGKSERNVPPRRDPNEGALTTWDPGGRMPRGQILKSKWPVEAMDVALGIVTHKNSGCVKSSQPSRTTTSSQPCTLAHAFTVPSCHRGVHPLFVLRPIKRAPCCPGRC